MEAKKQSEKNIKKSVLNFDIFKNSDDSEKFKKIRAILNLTQKEFALKLNIGKEIVCQIEYGYNNITPGMEDTINEMIYYDSRFNPDQDHSLLTDQNCIDYLKNTGNYKILKINYTEL